jgi:hypothetical protein
VKQNEDSAAAAAPASGCWRLVLAGRSGSFEARLEAILAVLGGMMPSRLVSLQPLERACILLLTNEEAARLADLPGVRSLRQCGEEGRVERG